MAQVTSSLATQKEIIHVLQVALAEWEWLAELPREWAEWDTIEKEVFQLEFVLKEMRLRDLHAWHGQGLLTPEQQRRYAALLALVAQHRPTIERLFAGE